jgi:hypothetical protein
LQHTVAALTAGTGESPAFESRGWAWRPKRWAPADHPVARLIGAALAAVPEPIPEPEPEAKPEAPDMRPMLPPTGPKPVRPFPKMSRTDPHISHRPLGG